jgi:hypothetical protein
MDDLDAALAVVTALPDRVDGPMLQLREMLPRDLRPSGPTARTFTIHDDGTDAGVAVDLTATRSDGRAVMWIVEARIYGAGPDNWTINIKAEIDLDDREGSDRCVVNEQQVITELADIPAAITIAAQLVANYPLAELLTAGAR